MIMTGRSIRPLLLLLVVLIVGAFAEVRSSADYCPKEDSKCGDDDQVDNQHCTAGSSNCPRNSSIKEKIIGDMDKTKGDGSTDSRMTTDKESITRRSDHQASTTGSSEDSTRRDSDSKQTLKEDALRTKREVDKDDKAPEKDGQDPKPRGGKDDRTSNNQGNADSQDERGRNPPNTNLDPEDKPKAKEKHSSTQNGKEPNPQQSKDGINPKPQKESDKPPKENPKPKGTKKMFSPCTANGECQSGFCDALICNAPRSHGSQSCYGWMGFLGVLVITVFTRWVWRF